MIRGGTILEEIRRPHLMGHPGYESWSVRSRNIQQIQQAKGARSRDIQQIQQAESARSLDNQQIRQARETRETRETCFTRFPREMFHGVKRVKRHVFPVKRSREAPRVSRETPA